jgi:hypothetical protein
MRLSDAGWRQRQTKLIYPNHRLPPWLIEDATPRSLEPIVRRSSGSIMNSRLRRVYGQFAIRLGAPQKQSYASQKNVPSV